MVSAVLGGEPLRTATWWASPYIPPTNSTTEVGCWDPSLGKPGAVDIATTGTWEGMTIGFKGGPTSNGNHAKVGVSTGTHSYSIFGDMTSMDHCQVRTARAAKMAGVASFMSSMILG